MEIKIRKAIISTFDKTGVIDIAKVLLSYGCELISTGGTAEFLRKEGLSVTDISKITGNQEAFKGRVKTISFKIAAALLFDREHDSKEAELIGIKPIDMIICNLYPFEKYAQSDLDTLINNVDIGGPTLIRSAAKNYKYVACITNINDYSSICEELEEHNGCLSLDTREKLACSAFNYVADYDSIIATTLDDRICSTFSLRMAFDNGYKLRYGENPHQQAWFLKDRKSDRSLYDINLLNGKKLSYNNIVDLYAAMESVGNLKTNGCAIIKHTNPCGLACGDNQLLVFESAWNGDPISAFGSVIAFNAPVEEDTVRFLQLDNKDKSLRKFVEIISAPAFNQNALEYLKQHKNLRIIQFDPEWILQPTKIKIFANSCLIQEDDNQLIENFEIITEKKPENIDQELVEFGIIAVKQVKSNAIVIVRRLANGICQLLGMGAGQPNRLTSVRLAIQKSIENLETEFKKLNPFDLHSKVDICVYISKELKKTMLVSDAFFPFSDGIEVCAATGIKTIIQPGGSIKDKDVINKCDELGIAMFFTHTRHFKH